MQRNVRNALLALGFVIGSVTGVSAASLPQQTFAIAEDELSITVASSSMDQKDPLESDLTIWVGEIEIEGRNAVWIELIDVHGEVIYDSEVNRNETHLLPDGRAVVVRAAAPATVVADKDQSRLGEPEPMLVTRRVVEEGPNAMTVEFIETVDENRQEQRGTMFEIASFGQQIWASVASFFQAAGSQLKFAWNWLVGTLPA